MRNQHRRTLQLLLSALVVGLPIAVGAAVASAAPGRSRVGNPALIPSRARVIGRLPAGSPVHLTIALQPRDPAGMQALATEVSTPGSSLFRRYLSVAQFAQRFGAAPAQIAKVASALSASRLKVGTVPPNHLTMPLTGTATQVERAFGVSLSQVRLAGGRVAYANDQAPTLASDVAASVQGVIGLDNLTRMQPEGLTRPAARGTRELRPNAAQRPNVATGGPQPCQVAKDAAVGKGYTADVVSSAYNFTNLYLAGDQGAGQTIALFELEPYLASDVGQYQLCYQTSAPITNINVDGGPGPFALATGDSEAALDIEQVIGLAPAAQILVYQAPNNSTGPIDAYAAFVSQNQAKVISSSWGTCEANVTANGSAIPKAENTLFQEAAIQGQSIFVASGDSGSAACSQGTPSNTALSVGDPSAQPFATAVGGTILYAQSPTGAVRYTPGDTPVESVWNDGAPGGSASGGTGGISTQWPMPAYQANSAAGLNVINSNSSKVPCGSASFCREVPDVSANSDPNTGYIFFTTGANTAAGWSSIGGTSAAAPLWAAFTTLTNALSVCRGLTVGFENPSLYGIAGSAYLANFTDVTNANPSPITNTTNNDALGMNNGLFPAAPGYDMATGLGTPVVPTLANSLCSARAPVFTVTVNNPGSQSTTVGSGVTLQMSASDSGGVALSYSVSGLPAGLSINPSTGVISGTPTTLGTTTVTVAAGDGDANSGSTQFSWAIANPPPGPPTFSTPNFSGVKSGRPMLSFTMSAGSNAPPLQSVSVSLPRGVRFAKKSKSLAKGISVQTNGSKVQFKARVRHGLLTITLKQSEQTVSVTIRKPAISVTKSLKSKVRRHKVKKLSFGLRATDTSNNTTAVSMTIKV